MSNYFIGLYSKGKPFDKDVAQNALVVLFEYLPQFFPAKFETSPGNYLIINTPKEFNYSLIPKSYWIEENLAVRIPILGDNGVELVIIDDRESTVIPSSLILSWAKKELLPETKSIEDLFNKLIKTLHPTSAIVTQKDLLIRDDVYNRSFKIDSNLIPIAIGWMTWLNATHLNIIGGNTIEKVSKKVRIFPCESGYILTLMQDAYDDSNNEHLRIREQVESELGLSEIYRNLK